MRTPQDKLSVASLLALLLSIGCRTAKVELKGDCSWESAGVVVATESLRAGWGRFGEGVSHAWLLAGPDTVATGTMAGVQNLCGELTQGTLSLYFRRGPPQRSEGLPLTNGRTDFVVSRMPGQCALSLAGWQMLGPGAGRRELALPFAEEAVPDVERPVTWRLFLRLYGY